MMKQIATYGTIIAGSLSLGAFKGYNAAQGNDVSLAVDAAMIGVPVTSGIAAGAICSEKTSYGGNNMAAAGLIAGFSALETMALGALGGAGSAIAEGVGLGAGYLAGYLTR